MRTLTARRCAFLGAVAAGEQAQTACRWRNITYPAWRSDRARWSGWTEKVRVHFTCVRPNKSKTLPRWLSCGGRGGSSPSESSGNRKSHQDLRGPRYFHSPPPRTRRAHSVFVFAVEMLSTLRGQRPRSPVPPPMAQREVLCGKWSSLAPELPAVFRGDDAMPDARRGCLKRFSNFSRDTFKTNTARQWRRHFG